MMADASAAVAQEALWSPWRDTALVLSAHAHLLAADVDTARVLFAETVTRGAALGNTDTVVDGEAELALLAMDHGRWAEAAERVARALAVIASIVCSTTPSACSPSPWRRALRCTTVIRAASDHAPAIPEGAGADALPGRFRAVAPATGGLITAAFVDVDSRLLVGDDCPATAPTRNQASPGP
jgi:hypothetical protein